MTGVLIFAKGLSRQSCLGTVHLAKPYLAIRAIFFDTTNIEATDLDLPEGQQDRLFKRRQNAEPAFLDSRDWEANRAECGAGPSSGHDGQSNTRRAPARAGRPGRCERVGGAVRQR